MTRNPSSWDDACTGKWLPEALRSRPDVKAMHLSLVDFQGSALPVLFMRYPETSFRTTINASTRVRLVIDVITVFPYPTPFGFVMPVIFDDDNDPFWSFLTLTLFPLKSVFGIPHVYLSDSDPLAPRRLLETCCNRKKCGVILVNERHEVIKAEIVPLDQWDADRPDEIIDVMRFLDSRDVYKDLAECEAAGELFTRFACFTVRVPDGKIIFLPRNRWPHISSNYIYPLRVSHGRLIRRDSDSSHHGNTRFDVFISHAHADSSFAYALRDWLVVAWPGLRVFVTNPDNRREFESNPAYFLDHAQASTLMLFLVSAISINRPIVVTEVGLQAGKPILPLLIGGVSCTDLEGYAAKQLFACIDTSCAIDLTERGGWDSLGRAVARFCGISPPERFSDPPTIVPRRAVDEDRDVSTDYVIYWESVIRKVLRRQTEDEAAIVLNGMLRAVSGTKIPTSSIEAMQEFDVHSKLIIFLMHWDDDMFWRYTVGQTPALLTPTLYEVVLLHVANFDGPPQEHDRLKRLARFLHDAVAMQRANDES